jgi:HipA-like protein
MRLAIEHVRRMKGGAQSHLMRCDDGGYYIVKFQNNPQHLRVLANEMLATRLAARLGICVPQVEIVDVTPSLIGLTSELVMQMPRGRVPCSSGKQFGSRFPGNPSVSVIHEYLPDEDLNRVTNLDNFLGMYVFDKWTCNTDSRQSIFVELTNTGCSPESNKTFQAIMIDQGFCFNGGHWNFPDAPLRALYANRHVYQSLEGIETFDPWVDRLESEFSLNDLYEEAKQIPLEWIGQDCEARDMLIEKLFVRRLRVRELIWSARNAIPNPFLNWRGPACPKSANEFKPRTIRVA